MKLATVTIRIPDLYGTGIVSEWNGVDEGYAAPCRSLVAEEPDGIWLVWGLLGPPDRLYFEARA